MRTVSPTCFAVAYGHGMPAHVLIKNYFKYLSWKLDRLSGQLSAFTFFFPCFFSNIQCSTCYFFSFFFFLFVVGQFRRSTRKDRPLPPPLDERASSSTEGSSGRRHGAGACALRSRRGWSPREASPHRRGGHGYGFV